MEAGVIRTGKNPSARQSNAGLRFLMGEVAAMAHHKHASDAAGLVAEFDDLMTDVLAAGG